MLRISFGYLIILGALLCPFLALGQGITIECLQNEYLGAPWCYDCTDASDSVLFTGFRIIHDGVDTTMIEAPWRLKIRESSEEWIFFDYRDEVKFGHIDSVAQFSTTDELVQYVQDCESFLVIYGSGDSTVRVHWQDTMYITYPDGGGGGPSDTTYSWIRVVDGGAPDTITNLESEELISGTNITLDQTDSTITINADSCLQDLVQVNDTTFYITDCDGAVLTTITIDPNDDGGGGGTDFNFAHDNLTADDDRSHNWAGYNYIQYNLDGFEFELDDAVSRFEMDGSGLEIVTDGSLVNRFQVLSPVGMSFESSTGGGDLLFQANDGADLEFETNDAGDINLWNFGTGDILFGTGERIRFFSYDSIMLVDDIETDNGQNYLMVRDSVNGTINLRQASTLLGDLDLNFAHNNLTADSSRTHTWTNHALRILGYDTLQLDGTGGTILSNSSGIDIDGEFTTTISASGAGTTDLNLFSEGTTGRMTLTGDNIYLTETPPTGSAGFYDLVVRDNSTGEVKLITDFDISDDTHFMNTNLTGTANRSHNSGGNDYLHRGIDYYEIRAINGEIHLGDGSGARPFYIYGEDFAQASAARIETDGELEILSTDGDILMDADINMDIVGRWITLDSDIDIDFDAGIGSIDFVSYDSIRLLDDITIDNSADSVLVWDHTGTVRLREASSITSPDTYIDSLRYGVGGPGFDMDTVTILRDSSGTWVEQHQVIMNDSVRTWSLQDSGVVYWDASINDFNTDVAGFRYSDDGDAVAIHRDIWTRGGYAKLSVGGATFIGRDTVFPGVTKVFFQADDNDDELTWELHVTDDAIQLWEPDSYLDIDPQWQVDTTGQLTWTQYDANLKFYNPGALGMVVYGGGGLMYQLPFDSLGNFDISGADYDFRLLDQNDTLLYPVRDWLPSDSTHLDSLVYRPGPMRIGEHNYVFPFDSVNTRLRSDSSEILLQLYGEHSLIDMHRGYIPHFWLRNDFSDWFHTIYDNRFDEAALVNRYEIGVVGPDFVGEVLDTNRRSIFTISGLADSLSMNLIQDYWQSNIYTQAEGRDTVRADSLLNAAFTFFDKAGRMIIASPDSVGELFNIVASGPQEVEYFAIKGDSAGLKLENTVGDTSWYAINTLDVSKFDVVSNDSLILEGDDVHISAQTTLDLHAFGAIDMSTQADFIRMISFDDLIMHSGGDIDIDWPGTGDLYLGGLDSTGFNLDSVLVANGSGAVGWQSLAGFGADSLGHNWPDTYIIRGDDTRGGQADAQLVFDGATMGIQSTTNSHLLFSKTTNGSVDYADLHIDTDMEGIRVLAGPTYNASAYPALQFWELGSSFEGMYFDFPSGLDVDFRINGSSSRFMIDGDNNGRVGVNQASPATQFHTNGTVRLDNLGTPDEVTNVLYVDDDNDVGEISTSSLASAIGALTSIELWAEGVNVADIDNNNEDIAFRATSGGGLALTGITTGGGYEFRYGIATGGVTSAMIENGTITSTDILDNTITQDDIGPSGVGSSELAAESVTESKLLVTAGSATNGYILASNGGSGFQWFPQSTVADGQGMINFLWDADGSGPTTIDDGETISVVGGTNVTTSRSGNVITVNASSGAADGDGIYDGSGTAPNGTNVTLAGTLEFDLSDTDLFSVDFGANDLLHIDNAETYLRGTSVFIGNRLQTGDELELNASSTEVWIGHEGVVDGTITSASDSYVSFNQNGDVEIAASGNSNTSSVDIYAENEIRLWTNAGAGSGDIELNPTGQAVYNGTEIAVVSDLRLKKDIKPIQDPYGKVLALNPIEYTLKKNGHKALGYVAQEYQKVFPEQTRTDGDGYLNIGYQTANTATTAAVQQLIKDNEAQKNQIDQLHRIIARMNNRLTALEKQ